MNKRVKNKAKLAKKINETKIKITKEVKDRKKRVANLKKQVEKPKPAISDHAVLRYLERYYNLDSDMIRKEMYTSDVEYALKHKAASVPIGDMVFKIRDGVVTTVIRKDM